jgi:hypothetical protein
MILLCIPTTKLNQPWQFQHLLHLTQQWQWWQWINLHLFSQQLQWHCG